MKILVRTIKVEKDSILGSELPIPKEPKAICEQSIENYKQYHTALEAFEKSFIEFSDKADADDLMLISTAQHGNYYSITPIECDAIDAKLARILSTGDRHKYMPLKGQVLVLTDSKEEKEEMFEPK